MFAGKKSAQIREILISESAWEEMTCLFAPSLRPTQDVLHAMKDGYEIPGILESNYPISIWEDELYRNKLEKRTRLSEILTEEKANELIQSETKLSDDLEDKIYRLKVEYYIPKSRKIPLANKISQMSDKESRTCLIFLEKTLKDVEKFFFPE
ncbi:hypothetical protein JR904_08950 [Enterobacter roggenkampii]|nr:hypothetical protein [Enterobacter roggenkampii]